MPFNQIPCSPVQEIIHPVFASGRLRLFLKRDDLIHPVVSGNKWRKLKYNLLHMQEQKAHVALTFGGAHSNHLHAFAAASAAMGLRGIAVVRGERAATLSPTLQWVRSRGVVLHFVTRSDYRRRREPDYIEQLRQRFGAFHLIPEGGSNALAVRGVSELVEEVNAQLDRPFDVIVSAVGSGGTLAGLIAGLHAGQRALGVAVLKNGAFLRDDIAALVPAASPASWTLHTGYHCGGYARVNEALIAFMHDFTRTTGVPLEPVYTAKMMYALFALAKNGYFAPGQHIVALHTGGMQGAAAMARRYPSLNAG